MKTYLNKSVPKKIRFAFKLKIVWDVISPGLASNCRITIFVFNNYIAAFNVALERSIQVLQLSISINHGIDFD